MASAHVVLIIAVFRNTGTVVCAAGYAPENVIFEVRSDLAAVQPRIYVGRAETFAVIGHNINSLFKVAESVVGIIFLIAYFDMPKTQLA